MRIKCVRLSNNGYLVSIPVKTGQTIRINIDIDKKIISINEKNNRIYCTNKQFEL